MVAYTAYHPAQYSASTTFDSNTSVQSTKTTTSDMYYSDKTIYDKDTENGLLSSYDDHEELSLSLDDMVSREATFRENKLYALLLRRETIDLFDAISSEDDIGNQSVISRIIFQSNEHLLAFAELVTENLITFATGHITLTPLCHRIMATIAEEWEDEP
jgi:hypothetical protein